MEHKIYWEQRMRDLIKSENKIMKEMERVYKRAYSKLELALSDIYIQMMEDGAVSPANLYKYDRYSTLQAKIKELSGEIGREEQIILTDYLKELYASEFQQYSEFMGDTTFYNVYPQQIEAAVRTNWNGEHFSSRVWANKSLLVEQLDKVIMDGIALGVSRKKMNQMMLKRLDVAYYCSDRVVRTESMFIYNRAHLDYYQKAGLTQYEFLATDDSRTSKKCREKNGNVYLLSEAEVGYNYPPLHPHCRSTVIPVIRREY